MISKRQFEILAYLEKQDEFSSQRNIASNIGASLGSVNNDVQELTDLKYIEDGIITKNGVAALKPYQVEKAVFIAAGFGSRMVPITLNTPKPLVRVNGVRIIDSLIDAVLEAGIKEIYIVRGYLSEQFDQLLYKYPMIKFIDNPVYNETNNISSAIVAKELFKNAYIFEADMLLYNKDLITKYQYSSNYVGVPVERTDDWCLVTKNQRVVEFKLGGKNCYHMYGLAYISDKDGEKFSKHVESVYQSPGGKQRFWDYVILTHYLEEYDISVRTCTFEDIVEIDTFKELQELDPTYKM